MSQHIAPAAENDFGAASFGGMDTFDESNMINMTFQETPQKSQRKRQKRTVKADQAIEIARNYGRESNIDDLLISQQFVPVTRDGNSNSLKREMIETMDSVIPNLFRGMDLNMLKPVGLEVPTGNEKSSIVKLNLVMNARINESELRNSASRLDFGNISVIKNESFAADETFGASDDLGFNHQPDSILEAENSRQLSIDMNPIEQPAEDNLGIALPSAIEFDDLDEKPAEEIKGITSNTSKAFIFISDALLESKDGTVNFDKVTAAAHVVFANVVEQTYCCNTVF